MSRGSPVPLTNLRDITVRFMPLEEYEVLRSGTGEYGGGGYPASGNVWAVQANLGKAARKKLRDALLVLSPEHAQHDEILRRFNSGGFYPADDDAYSDLEEIASTMELLR